MRKLLSICFAVFFSALTSPAASAATVTLSSVSAECGSTLSMAVSLREAESFVEVEFTVVYDPARLSFFTMQLNSTLQAAWYIDPGVPQGGVVTIRVRPPAAMTVDSPLGVLQFRVSSSSFAGSTMVQVTNVKTQLAGLIGTLAGSGSPGSVSFQCRVVVAPPPGAPSLNAVTLSPSSVELSWNAVPGALQYRLIRGGSELLVGSERRLLDTNLNAGTQYCYTVRSIGETGEGPPSPPVCVTTPPTCTSPNSAPTLTVAAEGTSAVRLMWPSVPNATAYRLARDGAQIHEGSGLSFTDSGRAPATRYCYTIQAVSQCGASAPSLPVCATTEATCEAPASAPDLLARDIGSSSIRLSWSSVARATSYSLIRDGAVLHSGESRVFDDVLLAPDRRYCYRVVASSGCGSTETAETCVTTAPAAAKQFFFTQLAGSDGGRGFRDGVGRSARFHVPFGLAFDSGGNLYVADSNNHTIRRITPSGVVTTLAGAAGQPGSQDGIGSASRFYLPSGVAVDSANNIYVADEGNHTIRKLSPAGAVTTLAGAPGETGSSDGTESTARFSFPRGLAADAEGNIYVADAGTHIIRKIAPSGAVTTLAGTAGQSGSTDGLRAEARFDVPSSLALDRDGNLYVADSRNHIVRKVTQSGAVSTIAGLADQPGSGDGDRSTARFDRPEAVAVDGAGNVYVADYNNFTIRRITPTGLVSTFAGTARQRGSTDGTGPAARFSLNRGLAFDSAGNLYVADGNQAIRHITPERRVDTFAGKAGETGVIDGTGSDALFFLPRGAAVDSAGNLFVADYLNHTIRKITPAGVVSTFAGAPAQAGSQNGAGDAARFSLPLGLAIDGSDNLYVADSGNHTIRKITSSRLVSTLAGEPRQIGTANGFGSEARFNVPANVALDGAGNIYVSDSRNHTIRRVSPAGEVSTLAGSAGQAGSSNGTGSNARFNTPSGLVLDGSGNVYVADLNHIRKITPEGTVTTLAGLGQTGNSDGIGEQARFNLPTGVAIDGLGDLYVSDSRNHTIRKITPAGVVTTLIGVAGLPGLENGTASETRLIDPFGLAFDDSGNLFIAEQYSIRHGMVCPGQSRCPSAEPPPSRRRGVQRPN